MKRPWLAAFGIFLFTGAVYAAVGPGRIDMIDGQYRYEVAKNIIEDGSVQIRDMALGGAVGGLLGAYSSYGISGSVVAVPLVALARMSGAPSPDRDQFFFSFTSALFGAAAAALLFLFYTRLGVEPRRALGWTMVSAFATLVFYGATTVFDQIQHGFFILLACFCAYEGARRDSMAWMGAAGAALAVLVNFQETYAVVVPGVAIAALSGSGPSRPERRRAFERAFVVALVAGFGLLFYAGYNSFRFGSMLFSGKGVNHPSPVGNPLIGLPGLLVSPGKSIVLFSPTVVIALLGLRRLLAAARALGAAVIATCLAHLAVISSVSFYGGDWCWGPRYFIATLPLLALGYPFAGAATRGRRVVFGTLVGLGIAVQAMGLSIDHHRFFYARSLPAFFWYTDRTFYFHESQLLARPGELLDSLRHGVPREAVLFRPGPYQDQLTYAVFGGWGRPDLPAPVWMRFFKVFWLPRPWPLWMRAIAPERRPIDVGAAVLVLALAAIAGAISIRAGLAPRPQETHAAA